MPGSVACAAPWKTVRWQECEREVPDERQTQRLIPVGSSPASTNRTSFGQRPASVLNGRVQLEITPDAELICKHNMSGSTAHPVPVAPIEGAVARTDANPCE